MSDLPAWVLLTKLAVLIACSAFFSSSETAMLSLNRYRLKNLAEKGHRSARLANYYFFYLIYIFQIINSTFSFLLQVRKLWKYEEKLIRYDNNNVWTL